MIFSGVNPNFIQEWYERLPAGALTFNRTTRISSVIDLNEWLNEGRQKWELVEQHGEVFIPWRNPWYRFAGIALIGLIMAVAGYFWQIQGVAVAGLGVLVIGSMLAAPLFISGSLVGGIAAFVSKEGCSIGCGYDRLFIPWSAVNIDVEKLPINDKFMLIPIKQSAAEEVFIQSQDGSSVKWNQQDYKRAIIRAKYYPEEGIRIYAYPNEIMVHFLTFLYPIILYRSHSKLDDTPNADLGTKV